MCDKPPEYTPRELADIWKGKYHGEPVCIKVIREQYLWRLRWIEGVRRTFCSTRRCTQFALHQIYRHVIEESKRNPHPNVLPIIDVSEALYPFCIMSPWTPGGNITQHIQMNPSANRLMLVRAHRS